MTKFNATEASVRSICVLRLSALGDVCHAVAVVQALQRHFPRVAITWVIGRVESELVKTLPDIRVVVFDKRGGLGAYRKLRRDLPETFDVLLHMQVALRANVLAGCIRARRKLGFPPHLAKEGHGWFVNERVTAPARPHVLEGFAAFAHALGVPPFAPAWELPIAPQDRQWLAQLEREHGLQQRNLLVIAPAASNPERNWLASRYAQVAEHAVGKGFAVAVVGGPGPVDRQLGRAVAEACEHDCIDLVGKTQLMQLLALLQRAAVVLCPDSGPAHMATMMGTPVIGLYAHSNPARTGPYHSQQWVVEVYHRHLGAGRENRARPPRWGTRLKGHQLMADISVGRVVDMFDALCRVKGITAQRI